MRTAKGPAELRSRHVCVMMPARTRRGHTTRESEADVRGKVKGKAHEGRTVADGRAAAAGKCRRDRAVQRRLVSRHRAVGGRTNGLKIYLLIKIL